MATKKKKSSPADEGVLVITVNKKARRDYQIFDVFEAGLALVGSEVKSLRAGSVNLKDSYVREKRGELYLVGCHISPYAHAAVDAHEVDRDRKLLLHRKEIERMIVQVQRKGRTIVPLRIYFKRGRCKLEIALGQGKKLFDKRQDMKSKEATREMERAIKR